MGERVEFASRQGKPVSAEVTVPAGSAKAPAVVLVQEWWGLNAQIKSVAERLAGEGFVVVLPDLYHGKLAKDAAEAGQLMTALDKPGARDELAGAVVWAKSHPRSTGKVGMMGFCLGGALTLANVALTPELDAAVAFYGLPDASLRWGKARAPVQAHFSKTDNWATEAGARKIQAELEQHGKSLQLFMYDAEHAFMNDARPEVYSPENAKIAWGRAMDFLHKHLGGPRL